jgi:hypothetical protein
LTKELAAKEKLYAKNAISIEITAPRDKVWSTLWDEKTFRDWAGIIDAFGSIG